MKNTAAEFEAETIEAKTIYLPFPHFIENNMNLDKSMDSNESFIRYPFQTSSIKSHLLRFQINERKIIIILNLYLN